DQRVQFAFGDAIEKRAYLVFLAINLEFHATIRHVADPASDIEAFGHVTHGPAKPNTLHISFVENLERNHDLPPDTGYSMRDARWQSRCTQIHYPASIIEHRLFVRIDQTETASIAFNQIDRHKVLSTVHRRKPGGRFFSVIIAFGRHLFSALIIDAD